MHIFREHNKEAESWSGKGVKGREEQWVDTVNVVWSEVTGLCGFWDGSCENGQELTKTLGRTPINTKCGRVRCRPSLDAELGGCGMLMENLSQWIDTSLCEP